MDTNGDYKCQKGDSDLQEFMQSTGLIDHYDEKIPEPIWTYIYGIKRLHYILVDPGLIGVIERIGYLSSHGGSFLDRAYAHVDFKDSKLFQGLIARYCISML